MSLIVQKFGGSRVHSIIRGKPGLGNQSSTRIFASVGR